MVLLASTAPKRNVSTRRLQSKPETYAEGAFLDDPSIAVGIAIHDQNLVRPGKDVELMSHKDPRAVRKRSAQDTMLDKVVPDVGIDSTQWIVQ